MNVNSVGHQLEAGAIETIITLLGQGAIFHRVVDEIRRVEEANPGAKGKEKRAIFLKECGIIFDDLIVPIIEAELRILLEIGLKFLAIKAAAARADIE